MSLSLPAAHSITTCTTYSKIDAALTGLNHLDIRPLGKVSVTVSRKGYDFDTTVKNASGHFVKSMKGHLELLNRGFPLSPRDGNIGCCQLISNNDKAGVYLEHALAPSESETIKSHIRVFQFP